MFGWAGRPRLLFRRHLMLASLVHTLTPPRKVNLASFGLHYASLSTQPCLRTHTPIGLCLRSTEGNAWEHVLSMNRYTPVNTTWAHFSSALTDYTPSAIALSHYRTNLSDSGHRPSLPQTRLQLSGCTRQLGACRLLPLSSNDVVNLMLLQLEPQVLHSSPR